jgi:hypothetical protein
MKLVLTMLVCMLLLAACSDSKDDPAEVQYDPPELAETPNIIILVPGSDELDTYESTEVEYGEDMVTAYSLPQFIDHETPSLYDYELVSDDEDGNWSPRVRDEPDLPWHLFKTGFLVPEKSYRSFFPDEDIVTTYNVKFLGYLKMYRKVEVINEEKITSFQINSLETTDLEHNSETLAFIPLKSFITDYVTTDKDSFSYLLEFENDDSAVLSWENIQQYYWLIDTEDIYRAVGEDMLEHEHNSLRSITLSGEGRLNTPVRRANYLLN